MRTIILGLMVCGVTVAWGRASENQSNPPAKPIPLDQGIEVQTRGPIHQAFAQPNQANPQPTGIVTKEPPAPIQEEPPEQKPPGDNVQWIPGYWAWDGEKKDYLWVSGSWRAPPPGRAWMPGHWGQVDGGFQWVSGFWKPAEQEQVDYLPNPPASLEQGPAFPAPQDDSQYNPGCWVHRADRFLWRPGYWIDPRPGYIWNPATYYSSPAGSFYNSGYWDYPLEDRGLLFAPVSFSQPLWNTPGWFYRPSYVVNTNFLLGSSFFVGLGYRHYFFGNYFGAGYFNRGFYPWSFYGGARFDPLFNYYHWYNRHDRFWAQNLRDEFLARRDGNLSRRPLGVALQNHLATAQTIANHNGHELVTPLSKFHNASKPLTSATAIQRAPTAAGTNQIGNRGLDRGQLARPAAATAFQANSMSPLRYASQRPMMNSATVNGSYSSTSRYAPNPSFRAPPSAPARGGYSSPTYHAARQTPSRSGYAPPAYRSTVQTRSRNGYSAPSHHAAASFSHSAPSHASSGTTHSASHGGHGK